MVSEAWCKEHSVQEELGEENGVKRTEGGGKNSANEVSCAEIILRIITCVVWGEVNV